MIIRNARAEDLDSMTGLLEALFTLEADFAGDRKRQQRGLLKMLDGYGNKRCIKVSEVKGKVVGMCSVQLLISTAEGDVSGLVEDMVVEARYRGQGVGKRLMAEVEAWVREQGASRLQLLADQANEPALEFYKNLGWIKTQLIALRRTWD